MQIQFTSYFDHKLLEQGKTQSVVDPNSLRSSWKMSGTQPKNKLHCALKLCKPCNSHDSVVRLHDGRRALRTSPHHAFSNRRTTCSKRSETHTKYKDTHDVQQSDSVRRNVQDGQSRHLRPRLGTSLSAQKTSRLQTKQSGRAAMYNARSPYAHGVLRT